MTRKKDSSKGLLGIRSSAAEYLSFASTSEDGGVDVRYEDENLWLTQKMIAALYDVETSIIGTHIEGIFLDGELDRKEETKGSLAASSDAVIGVCGSEYYYSLRCVIAIGFRLGTESAVQFRKWASCIIKDYTIQGWAMDAERLKSGGCILGDDFFDRQLEKVREIRASGRKFHQKITDIYATSLDYDPSAKQTKRFFLAVKNKLHYAVHGHTEAELIAKRSDHKKESMGLTNWAGAPLEKIYKSDVLVANNYLSDFELEQFERIVSSYLDMAELQARRKIPMTMADWESRLDGFLTLCDREILRDSSKVGIELAKAHAASEFEKFRLVQDRLFESDFDRMLDQ